MSQTQAEVPENADIDRDTPQPEIHVEERRLKLKDYLKTVVKINGSDLHLQAGSVPMIRVDGRARFLDCAPPDDELMAEYVKELVSDSEKWDMLEHKGSVDVAFAMPGSERPFPHEHLSQPPEIRDRHAANHHQDSELRRSEPAADGRKAGGLSSRHHRRRGHDRLGQIDHAGRDHRQDQPLAIRANHHRRRSDRISARKRQVPGQPGRSRHGQRKLRISPFAP